MYAMMLQKNGFVMAKVLVKLHLAIVSALVISPTAMDLVKTLTKKSCGSAMINVFQKANIAMVRVMVNLST